MNGLRSLALWCAVALGSNLALNARAEDGLQWLEPPHGEEALAWARRATGQTLERSARSPSRSAVEQELASVLRESGTQPRQVLLGDKALRFWRDPGHPYGQLQVAPRDASGMPGDWHTVLDVGLLREKEGMPFEFQTYAIGESCQPPAYDRCLLRLAPGGGDEVEIREFDLQKGDFVAGGFRVGKSRAFAQWLGPDTVAVAATLPGEPRTAAGWPANLRIWRRGEAFDKARLVYQAKPTDVLMMTSAASAGQAGAHQVVIARAIDYSHFEIHLLDADGTVRPTDIPQQTKQGVLGGAGGYLYFQLGAAAEIEGVSYEAESILAYDSDPKAPREKRISLVFAPGPGEYVDTVGGLAAGRSRAAFVVSRDLVQRVLEARHSSDGWQTSELLAVDPGQVVQVRSDDADSDDLVATFTGFVTPSSQFLVREGQPLRLLARDPELVDAGSFVAEVRHVASPDGTRIDYFMLRPRKPLFEGPQPVLMTGYGAFGISTQPGYFSPRIGGPAMKLWLDRGGSLVIPAIRGGGERGEAWHLAAIRDKRQNSYDDFIAVVRQLVESGYAEPRRIGVFGTSNGGLLAAVMGTQRPDLFGAIVSDAPVTDLFRMKYMGMGAAWLNEYGDPSDPAMAKVLGSYSPVQNVREGVDYPPFLVTISTEDNRVGPGHARKLAYRLQQVGADTWYYEDEEGGHGVSDPLRNPELMSLRMSFLIDHLMTPR